MRERSPLAPALVAALAIAGCASVQTPIVQLPVPVLIGPRERIGQAPGPAARADVVECSARIEHAVASAASNTTEVHGNQVYDVHRSAVAITWRDDLNAALAEALQRAGQPEGARIRIDALEAYSYTHIGLGWTFTGEEARLRGAVTAPPRSR